MKKIEKLLKEKKVNFKNNKMISMLMKEIYY